MWGGRCVGVATAPLTGMDATNYTMLALGQPLHAYDARKLGSGVLVAEAAKGGEAFAGLGEVTLTLRPDDLVITDGAGTVVGLAGILGGSATAVDDTTTEVLLEAGVFDPVAVALGARPSAGEDRARAVGAPHRARDN